MSPHLHVSFKHGKLDCDHKMGTCCICKYVKDNAAVVQYNNNCTQAYTLVTASLFYILFSFLVCLKLLLLPVQPDLPALLDHLATASNTKLSI